MIKQIKIKSLDHIAESIDASTLLTARKVAAILKERYGHCSRQSVYTYAKRGLLVPALRKPLLFTAEIVAAFVPPKMGPKLKEEHAWFIYSILIHHLHTRGIISDTLTILMCA